MLSLVLSLALLFSAAPMDWHAPKPLGLDVVGIDQRAHEAVCTAGAPVAKVRMERWIFGTTADQVAALVADCNLTTVVIHAGLTGYDWRAMRDEWHAGGWGDLVNSHPDVAWYVEIGNEPEFTDLSPWAAREALLETYKMLALGAGGDGAWRDVYPGLRWMASVPLTPAYYNAFMHYQPNNDRGWIAYGTVPDYYDAIGLHVYGHYHVTDEYLWVIYNDAIRRPNVRSCAITEAGINGIPPADGMREVAGMARWTPCFAVFAFAYFPGACDWGGPAAANYHLCDRSSWDAMRAYNAANGIVR